MNGRRPVGGGWRRAATSTFAVVTLLVLAGCGEPADPEAVAEVVDLTPANADDLPPEASVLGDKVVALGEHCDRLGADDVTRIVGLDASEYEWVDKQCVYRLDGARAGGRLHVSMSDAEEGSRSFPMFKASIDDEIAVDGVGDDAVFREATVSLHVLSGEYSFFAQLVVDPPPAPAAAQEQLTELVLTMLESR